jgi:hypothetical protein
LVRWIHEQDSLIAKDNFDHYNISIGKFTRRYAEIRSTSLQGCQLCTLVVNGVTKNLLPASKEFNSKEELSNSRFELDGVRGLFKLSDPSRGLKRFLLSHINYILDVQPTVNCNLKILSNDCKLLRLDNDFLTDLTK